MAPTDVRAEIPSFFSTREGKEGGERREERCRDCRSALQEAEGWRPVQGRCTDRRAAGYKGELSPLRLIPCWLGARYEQSENPCKHRQDLFDKYYVNSARCVLYHSTTQSPSNIPPVVRSPLAASQTRAKRRPRSRMTAGRHLLPSIRWRARSDSGAEADIKERAKRPVWRDKSTFSGEFNLTLSPQSYVWYSKIPNDIKNIPLGCLL